LVRWGTNGFAFRFNDDTSPLANSVVLVTSSITNAGNLNPTPNTLTLAPASLAFGEANFTLTVTGTGFVSGSTVEWNGTPRITTFVSATKLTAQIYASDIAAPGTEQVVVISPGPGGGSSAPLSFTVTGTAPTSGPLVLTPSTLTFASQTVGTQSAAQAITLQNPSQVDVTGVAISVTGADASSFTETNTCTATLAAGASCQVNVVFAPESAGTATASISVASNAANSPQTVSLNGTAAATASFTVGPPPNGSGSATVTAGQPASYSMVLTPAAGYSGTLSLTCSDLPAHATCTFSPSSLSVSNGSAVNFTVAISTADAQPAVLLRLFRETVPVLGLCLLPFWRRRRGSRSGTLLVLAAVLLGGVMVGCGGGSNGSLPATPPSTANVAPGTYTIQIVATDGVTTVKTPLSLIVQ
jgi:Abnormal spindle-like microcephaly-assoc'd, ASPM-SPD-2-Hydin